MATVSLTLTLDKAMHDGIARRAQAMGRRMGDYLRQLVEAAYAARVGREKGLPASDSELDQAVRAIFCLAGEFDVRTIARATGFPESMVRDVLKGLSMVAKTLPEKPARARPPPVAKEPVNDRTVRVDPDKGSAVAIGPEERQTIISMWAEGAPAAAIAAAIGADADHVRQFAKANRDVCEARDPVQAARLAKQWRRKRRAGEP